jgi:AcrR family transcriptional regulator
MKLLATDDCTVPRTRRARVNARGSARQAEKSGITRTAILEATLACLADIGYARTTADSIVRRAGLSRGAMTHDFKSRAEVFGAAAQFVVERRAAEYDRLIGSMRVRPPGQLSLQDMRDTMAVLQKYYALPSYLALNELQRGARTDIEFRRAMLPLEKSLDKMISDSMLKHFPFLAEVEQTRQVLMDLIQSSMRPLATGMAPFLVGARLRRLLDRLAAVAMHEITHARDNNQQLCGQAIATQPEGDAS